MQVLDLISTLNDFEETDTVEIAESSEDWENVLIVTDKEGNKTEIRL